MTNQEQPTIVQAVPIEPQIQVIQGQVTEPPLKLKLTCTLYT